MEKKKSTGLRELESFVDSMKEKVKETNSSDAILVGALQKKVDNLTKTIEEQIEEVETLKKRIKAITRQNEAFISEEMRDIYRTLMPDIRREFRELYEKMNKEMVGVARTVEKGKKEIIGNTNGATNFLADKIDEKANMLFSRIGRAEESD